jgi:poly-gamma-glutamate synthesis protein (capsule biosynthesis protein)
MSAQAGQVAAIPAAVREAMRGVSWHEDPRCPAFDDLALLTLPFRDMDGRDQVGELVVARDVADAVVWVFARLHAARFPIARMQRIDHHGGDDDRSMAANNCSGFNFRLVAGTTRLSNHALGRAIDINPVQNPWVRGDLVLPEAGRAHLARDRDVPGLIRRPGPVTDAFDAIGWEWGGDWTTTKDFHHFAAR